MIIVARITSIYNFSPIIRAAQTDAAAINVAAGNRSAIIDTDIPAIPYTTRLSAKSCEGRRCTAHTRTNALE